MYTHTHINLKKNLNKIQILGPRSEVWGLGVLVVVLEKFYF